MHADPILPDDDSCFPPTMQTVRGGDPDALGRIDHYDLLRKLGGGGFGVVYPARDAASGVEVAIKTLHPLLKRNAEEMDLLREKFALVSRLAHPNIATALVLHPVRDIHVWDDAARAELKLSPGDSVMVMRYAPGVTLSRWRRQFPDGVVPPNLALEIGRQVAAALDYAHGEKIVHRDIKPANIMVETLEGGRVRARILDFGLAAEIRSSMGRISREKGDTSGTRPYMAPEQWLGRKQDGRADQYALACVLYELLSGAPPFAGVFETGDPAIMERAVLGRAPDEIEGVDPATNDAFLRALAKDPKDRFPTCAAFVAALSSTTERTEAAEGGASRPGEPRGRAALEADVLRRKVALMRALADISAEDRAHALFGAPAKEADTQLAMTEEALKLGHLSIAAQCLDRAEAALGVIREETERRREEAERLAREEAGRRARAEEARRQAVAERRAQEERARREAAEARNRARIAAEKAAASRRRWTIGLVLVSSVVAIFVVASRMSSDKIPGNPPLDSQHQANAYPENKLPDFTIRPVPSPTTRPASPPTTRPRGFLPEQVEPHPDTEEPILAEDETVLASESGFPDEAETARDGQWRSTDAKTESPGENIVSDDNPSRRNAIILPTLMSGRSCDKKGIAGEIAVMRALRWLKMQQKSDGSWGDTGMFRTALTGMAILTFLAHGEVPAPDTEFGPTVERAIRFLCDSLGSGEYFREKDGNNYSHPIGVCALGEAFAMTKNPLVKSAVERAVQPIIQGQNNWNGWDYSMRRTHRTDASYSGWCAQAIKAVHSSGAQAPGLDECYEKTKHAFDSVYRGDGQFCYQSDSGGNPNGHPSETSIAAFCMQLFGQNNDSKVMSALRYLDGCTFDFEHWENQPWVGGGSNPSPLYYWYFLTNAKFQAGGKTFADWNKLFSPELQKRQQIIKGDGGASGYMDINGKCRDIGWWDSPSRGEAYRANKGGFPCTWWQDGQKTQGETSLDCRIMDTALCALQLMVCYRYLPNGSGYSPTSDYSPPIEKPDDIQVNVSRKPRRQ